MKNRHSTGNVLRLEDQIALAKQIEKPMTARDVANVLDVNVKTLEKLMTEAQAALEQRTDFGGASMSDQVMAEERIRAYIAKLEEKHGAFSALHAEALSRVTLEEGQIDAALTECRRLVEGLRS